MSIFNFAIFLNPCNFLQHVKAAEKLIVNTWVDFVCNENAKSLPLLGEPKIAYLPIAQ